ncbi:MAG: hypothetical protein H7318_16605 [Oligoflexus sp.]|nr:hypothetical protein [Oligoflexus sp.]
MLSTSHPELTTQIVNACLEIFPEAKSVLLWGGIVSPDFSPEINDVDVIIEIDADFSQEVVLAERLKLLVQSSSGYRLDPFVYLTGASEENLEFIAPFGFYKANPFIPYLIQEQHVLAYGKSRLLDKLPRVTLKDALLGIMPTAMGALKRFRMDAQVEQAWAPIAPKHKAGLFVVLRTYFAFEQEGLGSKKEALRFAAKKFPEFQSIVDQLALSIDPKATTVTSEAPKVDTILEFVKVMEDALLASQRRITTH